MTKTLPKGHVSCLSTGFKYTPSGSTDIGVTFERIRRQIKAQQDSAETERQRAASPANVRSMKR